MKKQITAAMMILTMIAAPAMANSMDNQAFENQVFHTQADTPMQLAELSQKEMKETEGAFLPIVAGALMGGAISAWANHGISKIKTGQFASTRSTLAATAGGMIGGGYSSAMLRGAGIATSAFARSAWKGGNAIPNAVIRANGAALNQSSSAAMGKHRR
ncbi:hypothetical protein [Neisseria sicca]